MFARLYVALVLIQLTACSYDEYFLDSKPPTTPGQTSCEDEDKPFACEGCTAEMMDKPSQYKITVAGNSRCKCYFEVKRCISKTSTFYVETVDELKVGGTTVPTESILRLKTDTSSSWTETTTTSLGSNDERQYAGRITLSENFRMQYGWQKDGNKMTYVWKLNKREMGPATN